MEVIHEIVLKLPPHYIFWTLIAMLVSIILVVGMLNGTLSKFDKVKYNGLELEKENGKSD